MRVLCCGPESSGTRLLSRIVDTGDGITAVHRSLPHWRSWELLPDEVLPIDRAVFMTRNWSATIGSQLERHLVKSEMEAINHLRRAHFEFQSQIGHIPWWHVIYKNLLHRPDVILDELSAFLGVEISLPADEQLYDANRRWMPVKPDWVMKPA